MDAKSGIQIFLAILIMASLFLSYLSAKTWRVGHVVLVVLIFLSAGAYWYLAAATMKLNVLNREAVNRLEEEVQKYRNLNAALTNGTKNAMVVNGVDEKQVIDALEAEGIHLVESSIRAAELQLHKLQLDRGRVWTDVEPKKIDADGTAVVFVEKPAPHGIESGALMYVFEQDSVADGGRYLGQFNVTETTDDSITLQPAYRLRDRQLKQLTDSKSFWLLYEVMPIDRHDVFVEQEEDALREVLPSASLPEYLKDGEPAEPDDPADRVVGFKKDGTPAADDEEHKIVEKRYVRQLRDYDYQFRELDKQLTYLKVDMSRIANDSVRLKEAGGRVAANIAVRAEEKRKLDEDLARFQFEKKVVSEHKQHLDEKVTLVQRLLEQTQDRNQQLVSQLAKLQLEAARAIDARTGAAGTDLDVVASSGP